jgi:hypothetical protein
VPGDAGGLLVADVEGTSDENLLLSKTGARASAERDGSALVLLGLWALAEPSVGVERLGFWVHVGVPLEESEGEAHADLHCC